MFQQFRVHNGWTLAGGVLAALIIYDLWSKGSVTTTLASGAENLVLNTINALKVQPDKQA